MAKEIENRKGVVWEDEEDDEEERSGRGEGKEGWGCTRWEGIEKRCSIVTWMHEYRCNHIQHYSFYILLSISNKLSNESKEGSFVSINRKSEEIHHQSKRIISIYQISVTCFLILTKWLHLIKYFLTQFDLYLILYCS